MQGMQRIAVSDFSLKHTLECGQVFRFDKAGELYYLVAGDDVLKLRQADGFLEFSSSSGVGAGFVKGLFRLDEDYSCVLGSVSRDSLMRSAVLHSMGLRIMRQEPRECLLTYLCSANMSVPGVKRMADGLARKFGRRIAFDGMEFFSFPVRIGSAREVRGCGTGFRAERIAEAGSLGKGFFSRLRGLCYVDAKEKLMLLNGVGDKIADCCLLYSLGFLEAFPVDRWIRRVVAANYLDGTANERSVRDFAASYFGGYAGYAQQFLYHYARTSGRLNPVSR
ncbi:DNA lyase [Candidatus Woesearchaeota archaeon]|nr:DNA lyase [Candidatus Woesearchaeota archaeon]